MAPEPAILDFELPTEDVPRLLRAPALLAHRHGRLRTAAASIVWHDTAGGDLAGDGLSLAHGDADASAAWRLERLRPNGHLDWLPAGPAPLLATAGDVHALGRAMPGPLIPVAAFHGRRRVLTLDASGGADRLSVLEGTLRGVAQDRPACRVILEGTPDRIAELARALAQSVRLSVPRAGLAAQAIAVARGTPPLPRHSGAPAIPPGLTLDDSIALAAAHLADVILHWAVLVPGGQAAEPVHQMRVGVRRLRSALSVFRRAMEDEAGAAPWLDSLADRLKKLAAQLGAARDWDVFLAGTGAEIGQAFAGDRRIVALVAAAGRRRAAAYAALEAMFNSQDWRNLELDLALLPTRRPWRACGGPMLAATPADYAARALDRRLKHVLSPGGTLDHLGAEELHEVRKQAKRLRYATEFFAPLFADKPVRKYLPRLEDLQEALGAVNDTAVAAALMAQLGGGADRAFAAGVVQGFGAGRSARHAGRVQRAWAKFCDATPFWD